MFLFGYIIYAIIFGFACSYIAEQKGKDKVLWFIIGALLGIIGLLIIGFSSDERESSNMHDVKQSTNKRVDISQINKNKTFNLSTNFESPIDILWNSVVIDGDYIMLHSEFMNVSNRKITSINFDVECLNSFNKPAGDDKKYQIENTVQDLNLSPKQTLNEGLSINLSHNLTTRKVNIIIKDVLFEDGEVWSYNQSDLKQTEIQAIEDFEQLNIVRQFNGNDVISYFTLNKDNWICICGRNNEVTSDKCTRCERDKQEMQLEFSIEKINETVNNYKNEIKRKQQIKKERLVEEQKALRKKKNKRNRLLLIIFTVSIVILLTYYISQVFLPEQRLVKMKELESKRMAKISELISEGKHSESLEIYEEMINDTGLNDDLRMGILKIAEELSESNNYTDLYNAITLLINNDDNYKESYQLVINEYQKENHDIVSQLVSEMSEGNFESGFIKEKVPLVAGIQLERGIMNNPLNKYKEQVYASRYIMYKEGELSKSNIYEFEGFTYGGSAFGWKKKKYLYIGDVVEGELEGKGALYARLYGTDAEAYTKIYEGSFKDGRYDGEGVYFWDDMQEESKSIPIELPENPSITIIDTENPLIIGTFKHGVIEGTYKRYYSGGELNDTGEVRDGVQSSSKFGTEDWGRVSDVKIRSDIELVD